MPSSLSNKTILITGASGILGQAVNAAALAAGARTALIDHGRHPADSRGAAIVRSGVDLSDEAAAATAVNAIVAAVGKIDVLLNIAGGFEWAKVETASVDLWTRLYRTNVLSAVGAIKATLAYFARPALIVNVAAATAGHAAVGMAPYTAAKAGVLRLTEGAGQELTDRDIRVYSVSPTILDTPRNRADLPHADTSRWIAPATLARAMLELWNDPSPSGRDFRFG